ncbi:amidase [Mesorhizobium sp.]|uniref:amidase n=1 Tax=Mesorhizobium sp. TaxID=1871066 RepID=UPI000FE3C76D|nr:amidase [Mesorhizobium sp.]RWH72439.1 MAG: amidase [Mesorhizobium sp.]RWL34677.1 MAG: amidase [Mesorhizobium sp.]RWL36090.1 MAG: amidase [Mesorhizobium sp.]RWL41501.1 MAG: amidase [Mesorhizobium sp.]RWL45106.1 MAG: amidase [Mesorhizobium sp.]
MTATAIPLWQSDAASLSRMIAQAGVTPRELAEVYLDRISRLDASLNAFVDLDVNAVRSQADAATERQRSGRRFGWIDGLPIAIKDNIFVAGMPAHWGSLLYRDFVPAYDDICIERLRAGGAILLGKTTTPEFAASGRTESRLTGSTRLPWDTRLTSGGSSGGSAVAVSAGLCPFALATDAGGSTRMPAAYNGLVGLRPSNGRIPRLPGFPPMSHDFQTVGILARTVGDMRLLYDILAGPDRRDPSSLRFGNCPQGRPRLGWFCRVDDHTADDAVLRSFEAAVRSFAGAGYEVKEIQPPIAPSQLTPVWDVFTASAAARIARRFADRWQEEMMPATAEMARRGFALSAADYADAFDALTDFRSGAMASWSDVDVIVTPTVPAPAWEAGRVHPATIGHSEGSVVSGVS